MPDDRMFAQLMEESREDARPRTGHQAPQPKNVSPPAPGPQPTEDINTTPYISQNYRFTEDELRWLRARSFDLSEMHGAKVPQNTILRIALHELRDSCERSPSSNPLTRALSRLKK